MISHKPATERQRRKWLSRLGYVLLSAGLFIALAVGLRQANDALDTARAEGRNRDAAITAEAERNDENLCRVAKQNRDSLRDLLVSGRSLIEASPTIDPDDKATAIKFYDERIAVLGEPLPAPCDN